MKSQSITLANKVQRKWHQIDASKQSMGRVATEVANLLRGKHKRDFTPHVDMGDYVNSFRYYQRPSQDLEPLKVLLKSGTTIQVTGELEKPKHLFTSTKAILVYGCPKN
mgnify:CR=1 FL=1